MYANVSEKRTEKNTPFIADLFIIKQCGCGKSLISFMVTYAIIVHTQVIFVFFLRITVTIPGHTLVREMNRSNTFAFQDLFCS